MTFSQLMQLFCSSTEEETSLHPSGLWNSNNFYCSEFQSASKVSKENINHFRV